MISRPCLLLLPLAASLAAAGCARAPQGERIAREQVTSVGSRLAIDGNKPVLPDLGAGSTLGDCVRYAVLNHPAVRAGYQDWRASVDDIGPSRALPDPQFAFEADFTRTLLQFMPGLVFNFASAGKREAMAGEATASSRVAYRTYVLTVLTVASDVRKAWIEIAYLAEAIRLRESSRAILGQSAALAAADYSTGRGMGTLEGQVRLSGSAARLEAEIAGLRDRLKAARSGLKSALGLLPSDPDPVWPSPALAPTRIPGEDELWRRIEASNPGLARMRAMLDMARANMAVARAAGVPDFSLGAMEDLRADPLLTRPLATVSLPIWRSKIADQVAAAGARHAGSAARVDAERLALAAQFARVLSVVAESDRMIATIDQAVLPAYERTVATAEVGYQSGAASLALIPENRLMALGMRLERAGALRDREQAVTELLLMMAEAGPAADPALATAQP